jgi:hypothetical protein
MASGPRNVHRASCADLFSTGLKPCTMSQANGCLMVMAFWIICEKWHRKKIREMRGLVTLDAKPRRTRDQLSKSYIRVLADKFVFSSCWFSRTWTSISCCRKVLHRWNNKRLLHDFSSSAWPTVVMISLGKVDADSFVGHVTETLEVEPKKRAPRMVDGHRR